MIGPQLISDDTHWREAVLLEQAAHQFFGRFGISPGLNKKVQYRAFIVYRSPKPMLLAFNYNLYFIQIPVIAWNGTIGPQVPCNLTTKFQKPAPSRFIRNVQPAFDKQVFDIP